MDMMIVTVPQCYDPNPQEPRGTAVYAILMVADVSILASGSSGNNNIQYTDILLVDRMTVLDRMILSGGSVEVLMDFIQSALGGNTSGPSLCVDTGSEVSDSVSSIVTARRASESFSRTLELLENEHRLHKRKLAAMLATYVGKYVLEALDIYHFRGRVDC